MSDIPAWSSSANLNSADSPDGFPEHMLEPGYNDSARELMAAIRRWYSDPEWLDLMRDSAGAALQVARQSDAQIKISTADVTGFFVTNRRVLLSGGAFAQEASVVSAVLSAGDTIVTLTLDSGNVDAATNHVDLYLLATMRDQVERGVVPLQQGKHTVWIPAGAMRPTTAKGASAFASVATGTDQPDIQSVPFNDALAATGTLTHASLPVNGQIMTINGKAMTFTTTGSGTDEIDISETTTTQQAINTAAKLEAHLDAGIDAATYTSNLGVVTITHKTPGVGGNSCTIVNNTPVTGLGISGPTLTGGADESWVQFGIAMPKSWNLGALTAIAFGLHQGSSANVLFQLAGVSLSGGDTLATAYGNPVNLAYTAIAPNVVQKTAESAGLTLAGPPSQGDFAIFRLGRKPLDALDTLASPFLLLGLMLLLVYNASTDA